MKNKTDHRLSKDELRQRIVTDVWKEHKAIRWSVYLVGAFGVIWLSKFAFRSMAGSITAFKELKGAIQKQSPKTLTATDKVFTNSS